jgi:hypothetical protein
LVTLRGGGGGGAAFSCEAFASSLICDLPTFAGRAEGSNGGGSFLGIELDADDESSIEWLTCSYGEVDMLENDDRRDSDLGTLTQSGSSFGRWGLACRFWFRMVCDAESLGFGGLTEDLAILPLSSHHFLRSELAGGTPGSMAS